MIEVLFSEHEGLTMKMAKNYDPKERRRAGSFGIIGLDKDLGFINRLLTRLRFFWPKLSGKPVGGNKEDVVYFDMCLDIGDLTIPIDSEYRKDLIMSLDKIFYADDDDFNLEHYEDEWRRHCAQLSRLKDLAQQGEAFRIWYSNNPYSLAGFYYVCSILKEQGCKVTTIKMPDHKEALELDLPQAESWGSISEEEMYLFLPLEKKMTDTEIQTYAQRWIDLVEEKSDLRAIVDGELKGVSADYYDNIIRKEIPDGKFILAKIIGKLIQKYPHGPMDSWYSKRIIKMIDDGELVVVKKDIETFYSNILEKKS